MRNVNAIARLPPQDKKTNSDGVARLGRRWKNECAWFGEIWIEMAKRTRMVWRDWAGDGEMNADGMARFGRRWKNKRAWYCEIRLEMEKQTHKYGEIGLEMEKRTRMVWRDWA